MELRNDCESEPMINLGQRCNLVEFTLNVEDDIRESHERRSLQREDSSPETSQELSVLILFGVTSEVSH